jgi:hypothetical protein
MKYNMLNEILEVAIAFQTQETQAYAFIDVLEGELKERDMHRELTAKQRRVYNCIKRLCDDERKRVIEKGVKQTGCKLNGFNIGCNV